MLYFKPAGARGQALHQDQFYLRVQPGTCMAAWMALDPCDEANGCMKIVPGTQNLPVLCTERANTVESFTDTTVPIPPGKPRRPGADGAGGRLLLQRLPDPRQRAQLQHRPLPALPDRPLHRRPTPEQVAKFYHPVLRMDGTAVDLGISERGGPCGRWVDEDGEVVELFDPSVRPEGPEHE